MAIIKLGVGLADVRGKAGGAVFQKNRGGNFIRTYTKPTNPQTVAQTGVRARLAQLSSSWKNLTDEQRIAWNSAATNFPVYNKVGEQKLLSGFQLYQWLNNNLSQIGVAIVSEPPTSSEVATVTFDGFNADITADEMQIAGGTSVPAGTYAVVETTRQLSAGVTNPGNSAFRQIQVIAQIEPFNGNECIIEYQAKFGALIEGQRIMMRVKFINAETGQSVYSATRTTIVVS